MNPRDFLSLAERLVLEKTKAANLRSATSRAYYATHHVGCDVLASLNFRIKKNQHAHQEVIDHLQNAGEEDIAVIASKLQDLYAARRRADYEMSITVPEQSNTVQAHVKQAREMIESLTKCLTEPMRSKITASIRNWDTKRIQALAQLKQNQSSH